MFDRTANWGVIASVCGFFVEFDFTWMICIGKSQAKTFLTSNDYSTFKTKKNVIVSDWYFVNIYHLSNMLALSHCLPRPTNFFSFHPSSDRPPSFKILNPLVSSVFHALFWNSFKSSHVLFQAPHFIFSPTRACSLLKEFTLQTAASVCWRKVRRVT